MTLARFAPDPNQTFPFTADAAILADAVVVQGTADAHCTVPSAAEIRAGILGVAPYAIASGVVGDVVRKGIVRCNAAGTIVRGDPVVVAGITGTVKSLALATGVNAMGVGYALESAVSGDKFAVMLEPFTIVNGVVLPFVAGTGGTTAACACIVTTSGLAVLPAGADPTAAVLGISINTTLITETAYVVVMGATLGKDSGSGYTVGHNLAIAGATGVLKSNAIGAGTNTFIVGTALETATASQSKLVLVRPFMMQG